jgi:hypothetical protein
VDGIAHGVRCPWRPYLNKIYMVLGEAIAKLCPSCPQCMKDLRKIAMRDRQCKKRRVLCRRITSPPRVICICSEEKYKHKRTETP